MEWNIELTDKQKRFVDATEDEVFFGGAAGGGKSYVIVIDAALKALNYPGIKLLILRRSYPELERSIIRTFLEVIPKVYSYNSSKHFVKFQNGSTLEFGYCDDDAAVYKYQSAEFDIIYIDEATHMSEYQVTYLKSRIRGANSFPKQYKFGSNPGNRSHVFFRERFIEPAPPLTTYHVPGTGKHGKRQQTRLFIPAKVTENKFLMEADEDYLDRLEDLPPEERRQLLEGDWYVFSGQFFPEFRRDIHVINQAPVPTPDWRIYTTMDYGLDAFAWYCIAEDNRGYAYVLGEIFKENVIISDAAKLVKEELKKLGITKVDEHLAPSDLWNRRQETGRSVADIFRENGITLYKTSRDRIDGWAATKEWLRPFDDEQGIKTAKIKIVQNCVNLIRCLPLLQYDDRRHGDAAITPHEITHAPDALRGFCVYRSRANRVKPDLPERNRHEDRELQRFVSNDMFNVYGEKHDDSNYYPGMSGGYNPNIAAYSTDGISWTQSTLPASEYWHSVTYGDGKFVAVVYDSNIAAYSTDGISWTQSTLPASKYWYSVTYGDGKFVSVPYNSNIAAYSTDGINWTQSTLPASERWYSVTYGDGKFVAVAMYKDIAAYSTNGINWTRSTLPASKNWSYVTYGGGKFVAVAEYNGIAAYSTDGINWVQFTLPYGIGWSSVAYGDGKFLLLPGYYREGICGVFADSIMQDNKPVDVVLLGPDKKVPKDQLPEIIPGATIDDAGKALVVDDDGEWSIGTNGLVKHIGRLACHASNIPGDYDWADITYGNGKFVAISTSENHRNSAAAYSTDGVNWTVTDLSESVGSSRYCSITYGEYFHYAAFLAVSDNQMIYSLDGITWASAGYLPPDIHWSYPSIAASYYGGVIVVSSSENTAAECYIGDVIDNPGNVSWDTSSIGSTSGSGWRFVTTIEADRGDGNRIIFLVAISGDGKYVAIRASRRDWDVFPIGTDGETYSSASLGGEYVVFVGGGDNAVRLNLFDWYYSDSHNFERRTDIPWSGSYSDVAYGDGLFVAVSCGEGSSAVIAFSEDGLEWSQSPKNDEYYDFPSWDRVAYGAGKFVALGDYGDIAICVPEYSVTQDGKEARVALLDRDKKVSRANLPETDGLVLKFGGLVPHKSDAPDDLDFTSVAYGNGVFVAAAGEQGMAYSADGDHWVVNSEVPGYWCLVAYGDGRFVAVAASYEGNTVAYSTDGINWTISDPVFPSDSKVAALAYGGGKFVASVFSGEYPLTSTASFTAYSTDGINWTVSSSEFVTQSLVYGNGVFVAADVGHVGVFVSNDGVNWSLHSQDYPIDTMVYGGDKFVSLVVDFAGDYPALIPAHSTDGINWTFFEESRVEEVFPIPLAAYGGGKFVFAGYSSDDHTVLLTSTDGINFTTSRIVEQYDINDIAYGDEKFVLVSWPSEGYQSGIVYLTEENAKITQNGYDVTDLIKALLNGEKVTKPADYPDNNSGLPYEFPFQDVG